MRDIPWSEAEDEVLRRPITAAAARAELVRAGLPLRSTSAITSRRDRAAVSDPDAAITRIVLLITRHHLDGGSYRRSSPSPALEAAVARGLARRTARTTYRPTLKGIVWLTEKLGDWEAELIPPSEELP